MSYGVSSERSPSADRPKVPLAASINKPTKPSKRTLQKAAKSLTEAMEMQADYWRKQSTLAAQAEKVRILSGQVAAKPIKRSMGELKKGH